MSALLDQLLDAERLADCLASDNARRYAMSIEDDTDLGAPASPSGFPLQPPAAASAAIPGVWISIEDRLPEPDTGEVLVWLTGGRCAFDEWHMYREDPTGMSTTHTMEMGLMWRDYDFDEVTHWMPLPAAPEGDTQ